LFGVERPSGDRAGEQPPGAATSLHESDDQVVHGWRQLDGFCAQRQRDMGVVALDVAGGETDDPAAGPSVPSSKPSSRAIFATGSDDSITRLTASVRYSGE